MNEKMPKQLIFLQLKNVEKSRKKEYTFADSKIFIIAFTALIWMLIHPVNNVVFSVSCIVTLIANILSNLFSGNRYSKVYMMLIEILHEESDYKENQNKLIVWALHLFGSIQILGMFTILISVLFN